jgi:putative acetyltransferase
MNAPALYKLRDARPEDVPAIIEVQHSAIRGVPAGLYTQEMIDAWDPHPASPATIERRMAHIAARTAIALVAESGSGEIAGYGSVHPESGELYAVYVSAANSRRGVGRLILSRLEELAKVAGLAGLHLAASINAEPFYAAHGYIAGERGTYVMPSGVAIHCIYMRKQL